MQALVLGFCSSGYDFAIASSRPHLTMWTLQVAFGFVGNYAPCGLSPQTDGMPVILKKSPNKCWVILLFLDYSSAGASSTGATSSAGASSAGTSGASTQALILGFCSSGYDFAIASSRPHLTMWTLQVAFRFVGNYALCGLSPQTDGMPVILIKRTWRFARSERIKFFC